MPKIGVPILNGQGEASPHQHNVDVVAVEIQRQHQAAKDAASVEDDPLTECDPNTRSREYVKQIRKAYGSGERYFRGAIRHYAATGEWLKKLREERKPTRDFTKWVKNNCPFSVPRAYQLMKLHDFLVTRNMAGPPTPGQMEELEDQWREISGNKLTSKQRAAYDNAEQIQQEKEDERRRRSEQTTARLEAARAKRAASTQESAAQVTQEAEEASRTTGTADYVEEAGDDDQPAEEQPTDQQTPQGKQQPADSQQDQQQTPWPREVLLSAVRGCEGALMDILCGRLEGDFDVLEAGQLQAMRHRLGRILNRWQRRYQEIWASQQEERLTAVEAEVEQLRGGV